ncbi:MAG: hypothetical protein H8E46_08835 [FCB group bacterium]|nr:hypothetical protein [FCB group bacterium]
MEIKFDSNRSTGRKNNLPLGLFAPGMTLTLLGITVLFFPMLLVALIASLFIGIGITLTVLAWKIKRMFDRGVKDDYSFSVNEFWA